MPICAWVRGNLTIGSPTASYSSAADSCLSFSSIASCPAQPLVLPAHRPCARGRRCSSTRRFVSRIWAPPEHRCNRSSSPNPHRHKETRAQYSRRSLSTQVRHGYDFKGSFSGGNSNRIKHPSQDLKRVGPQSHSLDSCAHFLFLLFVFCPDTRNGSDVGNLSLRRRDSRAS